MTKTKKAITLMVLLILFAGNLLAKEGFSENLLFRDRIIQRDGNQKIVSAYQYFHDLMEQVKGKIAFQSTVEKDLRKIKLPADYVKGQNIEHLLNNFCSVYKGFLYKINNNIVNIYPYEKVTKNTILVEDYDFKKGVLYGSLDFPLPYLNLPYSDGEKAQYALSGASFSGEYFLNNNITLGIGFTVSGFYTGAFANYLSLTTHLNYHFRILKMHTFVGVGFGYTLKAGSDPGDAELFLDAALDYELDKSAFAFMRTGVILRIYKNLHFKIELTLNSAFKNFPMIGPAHSSLILGVMLKM